MSVVAERHGEVTGLVNRCLNGTDLQELIAYQCLVGCIKDQSGGLKHYDCL